MWFHFVEPRVGLQWGNLKDVLGVRQISAVVQRTSSIFLFSNIFSKAQHPRTYGDFKKQNSIIEAKLSPKNKPEASLSLSSSSSTLPQRCSCSSKASQMIQTFRFPTSRDFNHHRDEILRTVRAEEKHVTCSLADTAFHQNSTKFVCVCVLKREQKRDGEF